MSKQFKNLCSAACALVLSAGIAMADKINADSVVATVNGEKITVGQMVLLRNSLPPEYTNLPDDVLFRGILDQLIQQSVMATSVREEPAMVAIALQNERRRLRADIAVDAALSAAVTEEAIAAAYEARKASSSGDKEYHTAHILVATEDEAKNMIKLLGEGADFAALAKEHSTGPSGPSGGDLGWKPAGWAVGPFDEAMLALEPGQISEPVQTRFGWHVIKMHETRVAEMPSLDMLREELSAEIEERALSARIDELTKSAEIDRSGEQKIDPKILKNLDILEK